MSYKELTDYDQEAQRFAKLPEFSIACGTDYLAVKDAPTILSHVKPLNKILDLGCGTGFAGRFLKRHFPQSVIIGADINLAMLEQAKKIDPNGVYVHFRKDEKHIHYAFLPNTFDAIVCSFVIQSNQTQSELQDFLKNIYTMLRPGGMFLVWAVDKNLFEGEWLSIQYIPEKKGSLECGEQYKVKLFPGEAEVTGIYWSANLLDRLATSLGFNHIQVRYPTIEESAEIQWKDETHLAPYYVFSALKSVDEG